MNLSSLAHTFKKPGVLVVGLLLGVVLLYFLSRKPAGAASSGGGDFTLASQQVTAGTNVQLAGFTTDYNKAALSFNADQARTAATVHGEDLNAATTITLQSLATLDNLAAFAGNVATMREESRGTIALADVNNKAMLDYSRIQSFTILSAGETQSALARYLTDSNNTAQVRIAEMGYASANTANELAARTSQVLSANQLRATKVNAVKDMFGKIFK